MTSHSTEPSWLTKKSNLTQNQFLLWMGQQINPDCPIYNMIHAYRIPGEIDPTALDLAFQTVVAKSDALRSVIVIDQNGVPQQRENNEVQGDVELIDFSAAIDPDAAYENWVSERIKFVLDMTQQLFDTALIKLADDHWIWYLNQHHVITDAIATGLVYQATAEFYELAVQDKLDEAPNLPPFSNFVVWEAEHKKSGRYQSAADFWAAKVVAEPAETAYYGKHPAEKIGRAQRVPLELGAERSAKLREIAMEDGFASLSLDMSMFTLFGAILATTIHRITHENVIRIGTPYHGRQSAVFKKTIGVFIEIGLLEVKIEDGETFVSLGEKILEETFTNMMQVQPGISTPALNQSFNVMLNYINGISGDFAGHKVSTDWLHTGYAEGNRAFRLQVTDFDQTGELTCFFDLSTAIFGEQETQWLLDQFLIVVDKLIENHERPIGSFSLLTPTQHQALFVDFNATDADFPQDKTILDLFRKQVSKTPDAIVAVRKDDAISYRELDERSTMLAHKLIELGAKPEEKVALVMHRSIEAIIAIWGVIKSGAAYVPIDTAFPADRRKIMIEEPDSICVLVNTADLQQIIKQETDTPTLIIDRSEPIPVALPPIPVNQQPAPENLAYIIFTSGSTGKPKGTLLTHQGLVAHVLWCKKVYLQGEVMDFPFNASFSFDSMVSFLFLAPITGGKIVIYSELDYARGLEAVAIFQEDQVDFVKLTPSHMSLVIDHIPGSKRIKTLYSGGEELKPALANRVQQAFGREVRLTNAYGPTEIVVACTLHNFDPTTDTGRSVPIGTPGDNVRLYLLDRYGQPVPPAIIGELHVSSPGVARGYLNRPEITAERFLSDPFRPGFRMYKSGDMAEWSHKNQIIFTGRQDNQVKIRGVRIELSGLESILQQHPDIDLVVVGVVTIADSVLKDIGAEKKQLAVWFTSKKSLQSAELRNWLGQHIPDLMMPSHFLQIEAMPLTTSKKVNRRALPQPSTTGINLDIDFAEPESELEVGLATLWKNLLSQSKIGVNHNFFDIGGDSIMAIQSITQINQMYDIQLPIPRFFDDPTIQGLANIIEEILIAEIEDLDDEELLRLIEEE
ncbi:MAG: amino acid adenylation domain-containing protein [Anaerolineae bacterium]